MGSEEEFMRAIRQSDRRSPPRKIMTRYSETQATQPSLESKVVLPARLLEKHF